MTGVNRKLTPRQKRFVEEYLCDFNGTQAAIRAGYSEKTAGEQASRLLSKVRVAQEVRLRSDRRLAKMDLSAESVLKGIAQLAYFDVRKLFNEDGSLKKITELDDETAPALSGIEVKQLFDDDGPSGTLTKIKLADRGINLERLGRHLKLFTDRQDDGPAEIQVNIQVLGQR